MAKLKVFNDKGKKSGSRDAAAGLFDGKINAAVVHEVVVWQQAKRRAGQHSTKNRSEVAGGGSKPYKQKGTGRARQGTISAGHYRGGGRVFGPKPRDYGYRIPKKVRRLALLSALRQRYAEDAVAVWETQGLEKPSTKAVVAFLTGLQPEGKVLLVTAKDDRNLLLSTRNLQGVKGLAVSGLNVYDIVNARNVVFTSAALTGLEEKVGV